MLTDPAPAPFAIDLTRFGGRLVTSFYSNLVTRPTGRAVRMGVESQIAELSSERRTCVSILDFSQVRVIDYSCADEIVAKLLLRYAGEDSLNVYFLVRGLQEDQQDAVEAVLERHGLLVVSERAEGGFHLLGPCDPFGRACWSALLPRRAADAAELAHEVELPADVVGSSLRLLVNRRVAVALGNGRVCGIPALIG